MRFIKRHWKPVAGVILGIAAYTIAKAKISFLN